MAVMLIGQETSLVTPEVPVRVTLDDEKNLVDAYGGRFNAKYQNKAWNTVYEEWAYWVTDEPDTTGASYPGPGDFDDCTNYRVETVVYTG